MSCTAPTPSQSASSAQTFQRPAIFEAGESARAPPTAYVTPSGPAPRNREALPDTHTRHTHSHTHTPLPLPAGTPPLLTIWLKEVGKGFSSELSRGRERETDSPILEPGARERREGPPRSPPSRPSLAPSPRTFQCICSQGVGAERGWGKPGPGDQQEPARSLPTASRRDARSLTRTGGSAARGKPAPKQILAA